MNYTQLILTFILLAAIFVASACSPTPTATLPTSAPTVASGAQPVPSFDLKNTQWTLVSFGLLGAETPLLPGATLDLKFGADGRVSGSTGCNSYMGSFTQDGQTLTFGPLASTKRACVDAGRMEQEQRFLQAMQQVIGFTLAGVNLRLLYDNTMSVLTFAPLR